MVHADPRKYLEQIVFPVLGNRGQYARISVVSAQQITIESHVKGTVLGKYTVNLAQDVDEHSTFAPGVDQVRVRIPRSGEYLQNSGTIRVKWPREANADIRQIQGQLRAMFRADILLHPMLTPKPSDYEMANVQRSVLDQLNAHRRSALPQKQSQRSIVLLPPGMGKTLIAAEFLKDLLLKEEVKDYRIFFVVQNKEILDEATRVFRTKLELQANQVRGVYDVDSRQELIPTQDKISTDRLVTTTRTTLHKNLNKLLQYMRTPGRGPVFFVFDEAHHLGRTGGQFDEIVTQITNAEQPQDVILGLSATPWHVETDVVKKLFHGNVATAFVSDVERNQLIANNQVIYLSRLILFRAMAEGYLSPIDSYKHVEYLEIDERQRRISRSFLDETTLKVEEAKGEPERLEMLKQELKAHYPFLRKILDEIIETAPKVDGRPLRYNRGLIFVPSIAHAEVYAFILNRLASGRGANVFMQAYHSGLNGPERAKRMDWFKDEDKSPQDRHKYLIVISTVGEGFDFPKLNHLILAKPYAADDFVGMRELVQNLGRAVRVASGKAKVHITDFTGDMRRLLFENMDDSLVPQVMVHPPTKSERVVARADVRGLSVDLPDPLLVTKEVAVPAASLIVGASPPEESAAVRSVPVLMPTSQMLPVEPDRPITREPRPPRLSPPTEIEQELQTQLSPRVASLFEPWTLARLLIHPMTLSIYFSDRALWKTPNGIPSHVVAQLEERVHIISRLVGAIGVLQLVQNQFRAWTMVNENIRVSSKFPNLLMDFHDDILALLDDPSIDFSDPIFKDFAVDARSWSELANPQPFLQTDPGILRTLPGLRSQAPTPEEWREWMREKEQALIARFPQLARLTTWRDADVLNVTVRQLAEPISLIPIHSARIQEVESNRNISEISMVLEWVRSHHQKMSTVRNYQRASRLDYLRRGTSGNLSVGSDSPGMLDLVISARTRRPKNLSVFSGAPSIWDIILSLRTGGPDLSPPQGGYAPLVEEINQNLAAFSVPVTIEELFENGAGNGLHGLMPVASSIEQAQPLAARKYILRVLPQIKGLSPVLATPVEPPVASPVAPLASTPSTDELTRPWTLARLLIHPAGPLLIENHLNLKGKGHLPLALFKLPHSFDRVKNIGLIGVMAIAPTIANFFQTSYGDLLGMKRVRQIANAAARLFQGVTPPLSGALDKWAWSRFLADNVNPKIIAARIDELERKMIANYPEMARPSPFANIDLLGLRLGGNGIWVKYNFMSTGEFHGLDRGRHSHTGLDLLAIEAKGEQEPVEWGRALNDLPSLGIPGFEDSAHWRGISRTQVQEFRQIVAERYKVQGAFIRGEEPVGCDDKLAPYGGDGPDSSAD